MKTGATIGIIVGVIIAIVLGLIAYSYTQIQISLDDISFAGIDWAQASLSTLLKLGINALTGNWLGTALTLIQGIKLNLIFGLTNHGFFPVYIPDLSYDLSINRVNVGQGKSNVDVTIFPGETKSFPVLQHVLIDSLKPAVTSIAESGGMMNLKVSGTAYFKLLGLTIPIPFESTKQISIVDEIKKHFSETSNQQSSSYSSLTQTYVTLQVSSYQVSEGQTVTFSGRLTDSNGNGIPNQVVYVKRDISFSSDSVLGYSYTDSSGYFSVDWIATKPITSNTANVFATFDGNSGYSNSRSGEISVQVYVQQTPPAIQNLQSSLDQQLQQAKQKILATQQNYQSSTITNNVYAVGPGTYSYIPFNLSCQASVSGSFSAQASLGNNIIVIVLDQNNFELLSKNQQVSSYYNSGKVSSGSFNLSLQPGQYYIILSNTYSTFSTKNVNLQSSYTCN